jgi:hypothetical protein
MNPGTTSLPPASMISAPAAACLISAVVPSEVMMGPVAAIASAQGLDASPVHTLALMIARLASDGVVVEDLPRSEQDTRSRAHRRGRVRIGGSYCLLYNVWSCGRPSGASWG